MALSISAALLGILVSGFSTFGAKFVESQFGVSSSEAANLFGRHFLSLKAVLKFWFLVLNNNVLFLIPLDARKMICS